MINLNECASLQAGSSFYLGAQKENTRGKIWRLNALLSRAEGDRLSASTGQFNIADTYVVPFWLDWTGKHYDAIVNYCFYILPGKYNIQTVNVPIDGPVRIASVDNVGFT